MPDPFTGPSQPSDDGLTEADVAVIAGAVAAATAPPGGITAVQRAVLNAMCEFLLGVAIDLGSVEPVEPREFADAMRRHDRRLVARIVQAMLVGELLLVPVPSEVAGRIDVYAEALGVDDEVVRVGRVAAQGTLDLAMIDFERSGYFEHLSDRPAIQELRVPTGGTDGWERVWDNPNLSRRWAMLADCPEGSLGLGVWRFYTARGFEFPGSPNSAPPALAQHDWIHVLADYGSTVESEIEVFGLIARANTDFNAFCLLAMVLSLFETGYLAEAAGGFFQRDVGHISRDPERMGVRLGDAMSRGKRLAQLLDRSGRIDQSNLLAVDWFIYADLGLEAARVEFGFPAKSGRAIEAGSVGPWEAGGISAYQLRLGQRRAEERGEPYQTWGASISN